MEFDTLPKKYHFSLLNKIIPMGDMETTVDEVTTDVVDEVIDTTDDLGDVTDEWVALLKKYKIDPENFTHDDLVATLARLERAETAKRQEKSKKKESPVAPPTDSLEELKLRLFFIENEDAKPFKDEFLKVKEQYPQLSFEDALDLAKTRTPKESKTVKEWFQWGGYKPKPKSIEQLSDEEALELPPEKYAEYLKKTGKIM